MRKAQSTFDYLVLTGVILVVIVPLLFFSTERIDRNRLAELQDALEALKDGITQVNNLGFGTSSVVVLRVPKGVTEQRVGLSDNIGGTRWCQKGMLCYKVAGSDMSVTVPADVDGILPLNEGLHYVQLFNNGTHVLLYECGNNRREAFEQCDGTDNSACGALGCASRDHPQACKCFCTSNEQCDRTTGLCDINKDVCVPCSLDSECSRDGSKVCLGGRCVAPTRCSINDDCTNYPNEVCNRRSGQCEPCDIPETPGVKECTKPQDTCLPRSPNPNVCGIPSVGLPCVDDNDCRSRNPSLPVCDPQTRQCRPCGSNNECRYPNEICSNGACRPCTSSSECTPSDSCMNGVCQRTRVLGQCGDGMYTGSENCEFNQITGAELLPTCASRFSTLTRCSTQSCMCEQESTASCGNGIREGLVEECDYGINNGNRNFAGSCGSGFACTSGCLCQDSTDFCGDGRISSVPGREQCDPPGGTGCGSNKYCTAWCSCRLSYGGYCGDGRFNAFQEECESGVMGCPVDPVRGPGICTGCRCSYRDTVPPPKGPGGSTNPGGNYRPPCAPQPFCVGFSCAGDCPPEQGTGIPLYCKSSGNTCDCVRDPGVSCNRQGGITCSSGLPCPPGYACGSDNCCNPITGTGLVL